MLEPLTPYQHDCQTCQPIGHMHDTNNHQLDLYICPKWGGNISVILRYGNDGPDYWSFPVFRLLELIDLTSVKKEGGD